MPRPKSSNPARNISVSLPMTTLARIDKFNPRNRSAFFNEAVKSWINQHDPESKQLALDEYEKSKDKYEVVAEFTDRQLATVMLARLNHFPPEHLKRLRGDLTRFRDNALALPPKENYSSSLYQPPEASE